MSYSIGLSGLRSTNQQLGVISQNIANVNTAGFKSSRAEFSSVYSGGAPGGVEVAAVSSNFDRNGDVVSTGRTLDLAISGRGFFVLNNNGETAYTRAGTFKTDAQNFITTNNGSRLQGFPVDSNGVLLSGVVSDLKVTSGTLAAKASTQVDFAANLKADATVPTMPFTAAGAVITSTTDIKPEMYNYSQSGTVYDSLGSEHVLTQYFVKDTTSNQWQGHYFIDGQSAGAPQTITFDSKGKLTSAPSVTLTAAVTGGGDNLSIALDMSNMSQNAGNFSLSKNETDGYQAGELKSMRIANDGSVFGVFTNGIDQLQGKLVLADFNNPDGLRKGDNTTWTQSFSSGSPIIGEAETGAGAGESRG